MLFIKTSPKWRAPNTAGLGFTLIELMVVIVLLGVLVALAAPSLTVFIKKNRLSNVANEIYISLSLTRQSAVTRSQTAYICHTVTGDEDPVTCGGNGSGWMSGLLIYHPPTNTLQNALRDFNAATDDKVRQVGLNSPGVTVTVDNLADQWAFLSDGTSIVKNPANPPTLTVCDDRTDETGKEIKISSLGRITMSDIDCT